MEPAVRALHYIGFEGVSAALWQAGLQQLFADSVREPDQREQCKQADQSHEVAVYDVGAPL